ncbi:hypothetical protein ABT071_22040 [Streptomyces sp. NPDC002506]|uniref:hypothetical protein n=1 Tax=Streptomyces sp. NPDC002506 TaxID=3154536 RepID=UPI00331921DF
MQQRKAAGEDNAARRQQEHEVQVRANAFAWFYGTELGCAYLAQVFRLQNRDPGQKLPGGPTAGEVARELSTTLAGQDISEDIKLMEEVFETILRLPSNEVVRLFRSKFQLSDGQTLDGRYYRAEVLNAAAFRRGQVLRTQAPTSISGSREQAREFFTHRAGHGGSNILYVFDNPPARRLQTALNKSSTGESEGLVPDRMFFRVAHLAKKDDHTEVHLVPAGKEAQRESGTGWATTPASVCRHAPEEAPDRPCGREGTRRLAPRAPSSAPLPGRTAVTAQQCPCLVKNEGDGMVTCLRKARTSNSQPRGRAQVQRSSGGQGTLGGRSADPGAVRHRVRGREAPVPHALRPGTDHRNEGHSVAHTGEREPGALRRPDSPPAAG